MTKLLHIEPQELKFAFEPKKQISCSLQLTNKTDDHVAFKVKTTNPKKYCVRPNTGIILPSTTCDVIVTMQAQKEAPPDMQCKDKFLLQSVISTPGVTVKDINPEMFNRDAGNIVEECKLKVVYVSPPQPPSPVPEGSEEGSSPRASVSDNNGQVNGPEASRAFNDGKGNDTEERDLVAALMEEKRKATKQNEKLQNELAMMRREGDRRGGGGVSFMMVVAIGIIGIILGYLIKGKGQ